MRSLAVQSHYEVLEVSVDATAEDITYAAKRLLDLYDGNQMAMYGIVDAVQAGELCERIRAARDVLLDAEMREEYDASIGLPPSGRVPELVETRRIEHIAVAPRPLAPTPSSMVTLAPPERSVPTPLARTPHPASPARSPSQPAMRVSAPRNGRPDFDESRSARASDSPLPFPPVAPAMSAPRMDPSDATEYTGEVLRKVRLERGIELRQLADKTRISLMHLEHLEADQYERLPATVYLRGILVILARELGLDPLKVSRSYLEIVVSRRATP